MTARQIAIDGPAGAGKSTAAKRIADKLGYLYIDTGAMYRAIGLLAIRNHIAFDDEPRLIKLAQQTDLHLEPSQNGCLVFIGNEDVSEAIRQTAVANAASPVSAIAGVREELVRRQREMAANQPVVMDGRDIGTVVLPQAQCKVYLTASSRKRAERRTLELQAKGQEADLNQVEAEIIERDFRDSNRENSPLKKAADAKLLDNSNMTIDEVVSTIIKWAEDCE